MKKVKTKKYVIELTEEQASILRDACEVCARIGMYQLHDICSFLPYKTDNQKFVYDEIYQMLWDKYIYYTHNLGSDDRTKTEISNTLWDMYQVIRHKIAWDKHPEGDIMNVTFDSFFKTAKEEPITIKDKQ